LGYCFGLDVLGYWFGSSDRSQNGTAAGLAQQSGSLGRLARWCVWLCRLRPFAGGVLRRPFQLPGPALHVWPARPRLLASDVPRRPFRLLGPMRLLQRPPGLEGLPGVAVAKARPLERARRGRNLGAGLLEAGRRRRLEAAGWLRLGGLRQWRMRSGEAVLRQGRCGSDLCAPVAEACVGCRGIRPSGGKADGRMLGRMIGVLPGRKAERLKGSEARSTGRRVEGHSPEGRAGGHWMC
jgi:hypothetical protein